MAPRLSLSGLVAAGAAAAAAYYGVSHFRSWFLPSHAVVSAIYYYPVKSCRGISIQEGQFDSRGLLNDRAFMIVDDKGRFQSQRQLPRMALIQPAFRTGADGKSELVLTAEGAPEIAVPILETGPVVEVGIWKDTAGAVDQGDAVAEWLIKFFGRSGLRLVRIAADAKRGLDEWSTVKDGQAAFQDQFPFMLASEESLDGLNKRLADPLPMNRFRPNFVIKGCRIPFEEDTWKCITIGTATFDVCKPCSRCKIPTIVQETALLGLEPTQTLKTFRQHNRQVFFGELLASPDVGKTVRVGDQIHVVSWKWRMVWPFD